MTAVDSLRVGFVTQWYAPEPVTNPVWISRALRDRGLNVSVVTGIPNYPTGITHEGYRARGRYRESIDGVAVFRTPLFPSHDRSAAKRALNYLSFAAGSTLFAQNVLGSSDVNLVYGSPATAALPAMLARARWNVPYVLYIQDLWPDTVSQTGMLPSSPFVTLGVGALDRFVSNSYRHASRVAVISQGMKSLLVERGVDERKISVIPNWARIDAPVADVEAHEERTKLGVDSDRILVMYAGNHGEAQGLDAWIRAIRNTADLSGMTFIFVGEGSQKGSLMQLASGIPQDRLRFLDGVAPDAAQRLTAASDLQIISLADEPILRITIPGKVQACLASGRAISASVSGDCADLLRASEGALLAPPGDSTGIEATLRRAHAMGRSGLARLGRKGGSYYESHLSEAISSRRLGEALTDVAKGGAS